MSNNPFLVALDKFETDFRNVSDKEQHLLERKSLLEQKLKQALSVNSSKVNKESALFELAEELKGSIITSVKRWDETLADSLPMKALSEQYTDRIILLVFGKVNAGKSSFCNFLTEQFDEALIRRFCFENGTVNYFDERFAEGVVETTATIQGVELGEHLVLLDSPGLHSVTDENGELTRRFTDSADAVLWLTPSSSPGQVQELNDLKIELEKKKPLQPVITRSDEIEEDFCDELNDIVQIVKNKSKERRKLQEDDVISRVKELGLAEDVKQAVSVSVHAYRENSESLAAMDEAGLNDLFSRLVIIIDEAKQYKVSKARQQVINFLNGEVLGALNTEVKPKIQSLFVQTEETIGLLTRRKSNLSQYITGNVVCEVPTIVEKHKQNQNKKAITAEINLLIEKELNSVLQEELSEYVTNIKKASSSLSSEGIGDFEDVTIDVTQIKGQTARSVASSAGGIGGAAGGAVLGTMLFPGVGTAIGSVLGGLLGGAAGGAAGDYFVETETVKESVGVSTEQIILQTSESIKKLLPGMIDNVFDDVIQSITPVRQFAISISKAIDEFDTDVNGLKG